MNVQVHCLVENGAVLERADNSSRGSDRATGCQNPALVASLLKKGSKMGMNPFFCLNFSRPAVINVFDFRRRHKEMFNKCAK